MIITQDGPPILNQRQSKEASHFSLCLGDILFVAQLFFLSFVENL